MLSSKRRPLVDPKNLSSVLSAPPPSFASIESSRGTDFPSREIVGRVNVIIIDRGRGGRVICVGCSSPSIELSNRAGLSIDVRRERRDLHAAYMRDLASFCSLVWPPIEIKSSCEMYTSFLFRNSFHCSRHKDRGELKVF